MQYLGKIERDADLVNKKYVDDGIGNKQDKEVITTSIINSANWSNKTYSFESTYPAASYNLEVSLNGDSCTAAQYDAWCDAQVTGSATTNKIIALGDVPTVNIPVILKIWRK